MTATFDVRDEDIAIHDGVRLLLPYDVLSGFA